MKFSDHLAHLRARLEAPLARRAAGVTVHPRALEALLAHFDRLDGRVRLSYLDQRGGDALGQLLEDAIFASGKAMSRYPQPNYTITKVAEEAGEVVKAAVHCAEGRGDAFQVRAEIVDAMAMLIRLYLEGDRVHGLPPVAASVAASAVGEPGPMIRKGGDL